MKTQVESYKSRSLALPQGTAKTTLKVNSDFSITALYGSIYGGMGGLLTSLFFVTSVPIESVGFLFGAGAATGAIVLNTVAHRINMWAESSHAIAGQTKETKGITPNFFKTRRTLTEKRTVISTLHNDADLMAEIQEVHLVTNSKGVWVETVTQKSSLRLWDESMAVVRQLHSLSSPEDSKKAILT